MTLAANHHPNRNTTLRQLKIFEAVARLLSYSRAAEELHLTQPAVSTQVRLLEEHAGVVLLEQLGKKIYLSDAGHEMLRHARIIMGQVRDATAAMIDFKGIVGGTLNVAAISTADYFFPRLLAVFCKRFDNVRLNLQINNREQLLLDLHHNRTDVAVMAHPPNSDEFVQTPFAPHPYVVIAAPDHPLAKKKKIPLSLLAQEPFIVREKGSDTWNSMKEHLLDNMSSFQIGMEIGSLEAIKQAVMAGMGISFLSAHTVSLELQTKHLVVLDIENYPVMLHWYVVHHKDKQLPKVAQAFKEFLVKDGAKQIQLLTKI
jgi:LysR family transcriptional regulator, low CO2-responsive transcriptional regulator